ncbi:MAG: serine/threonine protein kinase [Saprospiraceae bacterium]|nr:serine/threonine protein kinase [Saprospiraceae bacterium]
MNQVPYTLRLNGLKSYVFTYPTDLIGEGSMASIYKARSSENQSVAIKVLRQQHENPLTLNLWRNNAEFSILHKNLMQVYEEIHQNNRRHIILEYIKGSDYEKSFNNFKLEEHLKILIQVLEGLKGLHNNGYLHRDIKPSNILIDNSDLFTKIIDYDLVMHQQTKVDHFVGTVKYSSPENLELQALDRRADLWSVGIILYRIYNQGQFPFDTDDKNLLLHKIKSKEYTHGQYNSTIKKLIDRALDPNIDNRFQSADEIIRALSGLSRVCWLDKFIEYLDQNDLFSNLIKVLIVFTLIALIVAMIIFSV